MRVASAARRPRAVAPERAQSGGVGMRGTIARNPQRGRRGALGLLAVVLAGTLALAAGCGGSTSGAGSGPAAPGSQAATTTAPGTGGQPAGDGPVVVTPDSIPDGRTISGEGNPEYTFLSLWKMALVDAFKWKPDAYLASASGDFVNNDGVPSEWMMVFRTREAGGKDFRIRIDPWGKITQSEETAPDDTLGTRAVMPTIIDSDEAVAKALPALSAKVSPAQTKDPRLGLGFKSDAGPSWRYIVLDATTGNYVTVTLDANTGAVVSVN
jgi:hypothetical protein